MAAFDLPTAYLIAGLLYLLMAIAMWILLRQDTSGATARWCLGGLFFGLSLTLLGQRGHLPDWVTYTVGNSMLFAAVVMHVLALRHALGRPIKALWAILAVVEFVAVFELFNTVLDVPFLRFFWAAALTSGAMLWAGGLAIQLRIQDRRVGATWMAGVYLSLGSLLAVRALLVLLEMEAPSLYHDDALSIFLILFGALAAMVGNVGFLDLQAERMRQSALKQATLQAREAEATRLGDQIAQLDRRRSVGEIAASLAHELSQPITNIYLISDSMGMAMERQKGADLSAHLSDLSRNAQKASDILNRIRGFIRAKETIFERVELGQVISDVKALLRDLSSKESVQMQVQADPGGVYVQGDPVQLSQILMNVCRNAIQATEGQAQRRVHIRVWQEKGTAHVEIVDNGAGLTPSILANVCTPFFSTKPDGLGVGLAISKTIAKQHGGDLLIDNDSAGGARVKLILPTVK